jgi:hypothetical protein
MMATYKTEALLRKAEKTVITGIGAVLQNY